MRSTPNLHGGGFQVEQHWNLGKWGQQSQIEQTLFDLFGARVRGKVAVASAF